jgi:hypothetical protein
MRACRAQIQELLIIATCIFLAAATRQPPHEGGGNQQNEAKVVVGGTMEGAAEYLASVVDISNVTTIIRPADDPQSPFGALIQWMQVGNEHASNADSHTLVAGMLAGVRSCHDSAPQIATSDDLQLIVMAWAQLRSHVQWYINQLETRVLAEKALEMQEQVTVARVRRHAHLLQRWQNPRYNVPGLSARSVTAPEATILVRNGGIPTFSDEVSLSSQSFSILLKYIDELTQADLSGVSSSYSPSYDFTRSYIAQIHHLLAARPGTVVTKDTGLPARFAKKQAMLAQSLQAQFEGVSTKSKQQLAKGFNCSTAALELHSNFGTEAWTDNHDGVPAPPTPVSTKRSGGLLARWLNSNGSLEASLDLWVSIVRVVGLALQPIRWLFAAAQALWTLIIPPVHISFLSGFDSMRHTCESFKGTLDWKAVTMGEAVRYVVCSSEMFVSYAVDSIYNSRMAVLAEEAWCSGEWFVDLLLPVRCLEYIRPEIKVLEELRDEYVRRVMKVEMFVQKAAAAVCVPGLAHVTRDPRLGRHLEEIRSCLRATISSHT